MLAFGAWEAQRCFFAMGRKPLSLFLSLRAMRAELCVLVFGAWEAQRFFFSDGEETSEPLPLALGDARGALCASIWGMGGSEVFFLR